MTEEQFYKITEWQKATFKNATALSKISHLKEEILELYADILCKSGNTELEFADCFFLLFGAAAAYGMKYEDICDAIEIKFDINKSRKWGEADANGVVKHVRNSDQK